MSLLYLGQIEDLLGTEEKREISLSSNAIQCSCLFSQVLPSDARTKIQQDPNTKGLKYTINDYCINYNLIFLIQANNLTMMYLNLAC